MTDDGRAAMLWHIAMERMALLNTDMARLSQRQSARRCWMRAIAEERLSEYFDHVESMIARNPTRDTPGDRKRATA